MKHRCGGVIHWKPIQIPFDTLEQGESVLKTSYNAPVVLSICGAFISLYRFKESQKQIITKQKNELDTIN